MTDLIKRLHHHANGDCDMTPVGSTLLEAADRIEELEERNKELTLQLLATSGQAADALDKLTKAKEFLKTMADYNKYVIAPFLAELEGK